MIGCWTTRGVTDISQIESLRPRCLLVLILLVVQCAQVSNDANNSNTFIRWLVAQLGVPFRWACMYRICLGCAALLPRERSVYLRFSLIVPEVVERSGRHNIFRGGRYVATALEVDLIHVLLCFAEHMSTTKSALNINSRCMPHSTKCFVPGIIR